MTATRTPRLDAVLAWRRGETTDVDWTEPLPGWPTWTATERLRCIIASCASGFPGAAGVRRRVLDRHGREIPPPPSPRRAT